MTPTVSVVIPVLNDADLLDTCLSMLRQQTLQPQEIIVVDNGCTDHTVQVATRHGARIITEPTPGIPAATAAGYDAASCMLIARLDADSRPPARWLENLVAAMSGDMRLVGATGPGMFYDVGTVRNAWHQATYMTPYFLSAGFALSHTPLFGSNMVISKGWWDSIASEVNRIDKEVHDDFDLSFHVKPHQRIAFARHAWVGISPRPFDSSRDMLTRYQRAFRTIGQHWATEPPWQRVFARRSVSYEIPTGVGSSKT